MGHAQTNKPGYYLSSGILLGRSEGAETKITVIKDFGVFINGLKVWNNHLFLIEELKGIHILIVDDLQL